MSWLDDNYHLWGNEEYEDAMEGDDVGILHRRTYRRENIQHDRTCRCCGETGLRWVLDDDKWALAFGDNIHVCPVRPRPCDTARFTLPHAIGCPYCGSLSVSVQEMYQEPEVGYQFTRYAVVCIGCGAVGPQGEREKAKAIELWNKRI